jgi:PAB-dependent poly(A)-specific ribonuclease subunit 2
MMRLGQHVESYGIGGSGGRGGEWFELRSVTESQLSSVHSVGAVTFDPYEEILWTGLSNGKIVSYLNPTMEKYTSFQAQNGAAIRQLLVNEEGILSLSENGLKYHKKGGLATGSYTEEEFHDLSCMTFSNLGTGTATGSEVLLGGDSLTAMYVFDLQMERIVQEVPLSQGLVSIQKGRMVCCGGVNGEVSLHDPRSYRIEHVLQPHLGGVSDIDIKNDILVTCGYAKRFLFSSFPLFHPLLSIGCHLLPSS